MRTLSIVFALSACTVAQPVDGATNPYAVDIDASTPAPGTPVPLATCARAEAQLEVVGVQPVTTDAWVARATGDGAVLWGSDGLVVVRGDESRGLQVGELWPEAVAASDDLGTVAAVDWSGAVRAWDTATGERTASLQLDYAAAPVVALSRSGRFLAATTGYEPSQVAVVDLATGAVWTGAAPEQYTFVAGVLLDEALDLLVVASTDYGFSLRVELRRLSAPDTVLDSWRADDGTSLRCGAPPLVTGLAIDHRSGRLMVLQDSYGYGRIAVLDVDDLSNGAMTDVNGHYLTGGAFVGGGRYLATSGSEGRVVLWDARALEPVAEVALPSALSLGVDDDGAVFAVTAEGSLETLGCLAD